jgi:hypothetical protein
MDVLDVLPGETHVADADTAQRLRRPRRRRPSYEDEEEEEGRRYLSYPRILPGGHRAVVAMVLLGLSGGVDLVATVAEYHQYQLLSRIVDQKPVDEQEVEASDLLVGVVGGAQGLLYLGTAVAFCCWIYKAHDNLRRLGARNLTYSPGWAVGGFFVPFLNLIRPVQVMQEIWKASDPDMPFSTGREWRQAPGGVRVGFWWAFYLLASVVAQIGFRLNLSGDEKPSSLQTASLFTLIADAIWPAAAVLAILVVHGVRKRQLLKYVLVQAERDRERD